MIKVVYLFCTASYGEGMLGSEISAKWLEMSANWNDSAEGIYFEVVGPMRQKGSRGASGGQRSVRPPRWGDDLVKVAASRWT